MCPLMRSETRNDLLLVSHQNMDAWNTELLTFISNALLHSHDWDPYILTYKMIHMMTFYTDVLGPTL